MTYVLPSPSDLPSSVLLRKLRTDYDEWAVYTPLSLDGIKWHRWWSSNRVNTGNVGAPNHKRCSLAILYASTVQSAPSPNDTTGTQRQAFATEYNYAAADSKYATEVGPGGFGEYYTTTATEYVEWQSVVVPSGGVIAYRGRYNSSVGGDLQVEIWDSGDSPIAGSYYTAPLSGSDYVLDLGLINTSGDEAVNVLTKPLPADTYRVRLTNATGGQRGYVSGLGVLVPSVTTTGLLGVFNQPVAVNGVTHLRTANPGDSSIYLCEDVTRVDWRHIVNSATGITEARVYDSGGAEIDAGDYDIVSNQVDGYSAPQTDAYTTIASGLTKGDYYLVVTATNSKNASSSGYRMYDAGARGVDETSAGTLGTDSIDDLTAEDTTGAGTNQHAFIGGELFYAIKCRPAAAGSGEDFVGGVHVHESDPLTLVVKVDDVTVDYAGGAQFDEWTGSTIEITYTTELYYPDDTGPWCDVTTVTTYTAAGMKVDCTFAVKSGFSTTVFEDYCQMCIVPNRASGNQGTSVGGGWNTVAAFPSAQANQYASELNGTNNLSGDVYRLLWLNSEYVVQADQLNWSAINGVYDDAGGAAAASFVQTRTDSYIKYYNRAMRDGGGVTIGDTHELTTSKIYRAAAVADCARLAPIMFRRRRAR